MAKLLSVAGAFAKGLEPFAKHCLRYGTVLKYDDYIDHTDKECRRIAVRIQGCFAEIVKRNGEVISAEYLSDF